MSEIHKKRKFSFPDPRLSLPDGLLCIGGNLEVTTLVEAYSRGIFPWPQEGYPLLWFSPPRRGIIEFKDFHIARSLRKFLKKSTWQVTVNRAFAQVISACAEQPRQGQAGTWILPPMQAAYETLHAQGYAHSVEVWDETRLIGGLYGVYTGGVFAGESMFHHQPNASKQALIFLVERLRAQGFTWMDTQMVTPSLQAFGGKYIERDEFLQRLKENSEKFPCAPWDVVQGAVVSTRG